MSLEVLNTRVTDGVAVAGATLPFWWSYLQQMSETAATLLPIAGLIWLIIQMVAFLKKDKK